MQQLLPILIGLLTLVLFGGITTLFWSEGRIYWGSFFAVLTAYRTVVLVRQALHLRGLEEEEEEEEI